MINKVLHSGWTWVAVWLVSRVWMLRQWVQHYQFILGDVNYYQWSVTYRGIPDTLLEYPVPVVWFLKALRFPTADNPSIYAVVFCVSMALLDALLGYVLWRRGTHAAAAFWIMFVFFMGPLAWFRYDMLPAVIVATALLLVSRRPRMSGSLVALGAAIKLWPALLILPMLHPDDRGRRRMIGFGVVGGLLALLSWATTSWDRLVSPLTWQSERGLQIESVPASVVMLRRAWNGQPLWFVELSKFNAFEITGPGVQASLRLSSILMVATVLVAVGFGVLALTRKAPDAATITIACVAIVGLVIVANKTLSPQYMFWLGSPVAALLVHTRRRTRERWGAFGLAVLVLIIGGLTQYVYPGHYGGLIPETWAEKKVTVILVLRNCLLVVFALASTLWAGISLGRADDRPERFAPPRGGDADEGAEPLAIEG